MNVQYAGHDCTVQIERYSGNRRVCLRLWSNDIGPVATATTNVPDAVLDGDEVVLDPGGGKAIFNAMQEGGWIEVKHRFVRAGDEVAVAVQLSAAALEVLREKYPKDASDFSVRVPVAGNSIEDVASTEADSRPGHYYVSVRNEKGQHSLLYGPVGLHARALSDVLQHAVKEVASKIDARSVFMAFGTARIDASNPRPPRGKLNDLVDRWMAEAAAAAAELANDRAARQAAGPDVIDRYEVHDAWDGGSQRSYRLYAHHSHDPDQIVTQVYGEINGKTFGTIESACVHVRSGRGLSDAGTPVYRALPHGELRLVDKGAAPQVAEDEAPELMH